MWHRDLCHAPPMCTVSELDIAHGPVRIPTKYTPPPTIEPKHGEGSEYTQRPKAPAIDS